jgi:acetyltransferase-like isoleucine patch superfamily enzyme
MAHHSYFSDSELTEIGFASVGRNVQVSKRAAIYEPHLMDLGDNTRIDDFCVVSGRVSIGRNVHVTVQCNVAGGSEGVFLEDFSVLAYGCNVFSQSDDYSGATMTNSTVPDQYKNETKAAVRVGRHVIVGARSVIFPGVHVAIGCSIGAMSLVNRSTEPWTIYAGVPAKPIRPRLRDLEVLERRYLESELA